MKLAVTCLMVLALAGCATQSDHSRVVAPATAAESAALLDRLKSLEGEWTGEDPHTRQMVTACVFKTTSGGSVVRETMFPGTAHEMTNMYHMDGGELVMTHYCAVGNQPRMRAQATNGKTIAFAFDSVTNKTKPDEHCMGKMTIEFKDADHIAQHWYDVGGPEGGEPMVFDLTRKK